MALYTWSFFFFKSIHIEPTFKLPCFLTTGMGSEILIYDLELGKMITSFTVFDGIRVHGITSSVVSSTQQYSAANFASKISVYGERRVKVFSFNYDISGYPNSSGSRPQMTLIHLLPKFSHWVLDVCFLEVFFLRNPPLPRNSSICFENNYGFSCLYIFCLRMLVG